MKGDTFMNFVFSFIIFIAFIIFIIGIAGNQIANEIGLTQQDITPISPPNTGIGLLDIALLPSYGLSLVFWFGLLFFKVTFSGWFGLIFGIPAAVLAIWAIARWFRGGG
jgi:hypothetical protein